MKNLIIIFLILSFFISSSSISVINVYSDVTDRDVGVSSEEITSIRSFEKQTKQSVADANSLIGSKEFMKAKKYLESVLVSVKEKVSVYENNARVLVSNDKEKSGKVYSRAAASLNKIEVQISQSLKRLETLQKDNEVKKLRMESSQYINKGFEYLEADDFDKAETSFNAALKIAPDNRRAKEGLSIVEKARSRSNAKHISELLSQAHSNIRAESFDLAQKQLQEVLKLDPGNRKAQSYLEDIEEGKQAKKYKDLISDIDKKREEGKLQLEAEKFNEAEKTLRTALDLLPEKEQSRKKAIESLITSIPTLKQRAGTEKFQEQSSQYITKGFEYLEADDLDKAETNFRKAIDISPDNRRAKEGLLRVERARNNSNAKHISELLSQAHSNIRAESFDLAQKQLQEVLKLDPGNRKAQAYLEDIKKASQTKKHEDVLAKVDQKIEEGKSNLDQSRFEEAEASLKEARMLLSPDEKRRSRDIDALLASIPQLKEKHQAKTKYDRIETIVSYTRQQFEENKFSELIEQGKDFLQESNFKEAKNKFSEALKIRPKNELVMKYLSQTEQAQKDYEKNKIIDKVIADGRKYMESEQLAKAESSFKKALAMSPSENKRNQIQSLLSAVDQRKLGIQDRQLKQKADEFVNRGIDNVNKEQYSQAKVNFEKALSVKPDYPEAEEWLLQLETMQRETSNKKLQEMLSEAKEYLNNNQFDKAEDKIREVLKINPTYPEALESLRTLETSKEEYKNSYQFEKIKEKINIGMKFLEEEQFAKAESVFKEAVDMSPLDMRQQTITEIENNVNSFIQEVKTQKEVDKYISSGIAYLGNNEFDKAEEAFNYAIKLAPGHKEAKHYLQELEIARLKQQNIQLLEQIGGSISMEKKELKQDNLEEDVNQLIERIKVKIEE